MAVIEFRGEKPPIDLTQIPYPEELSTEELNLWKGKIEDAIADLDSAEPKNEKSDAYAEWAELHETLEDILDDYLDRLDEI